MINTNAVTLLNLYGISSLLKRYVLSNILSISLTTFVLVFLYLIEPKGWVNERLQDEFRYYTIETIVVKTLFHK